MKKIKVKVFVVPSLKVDDIVEYLQYNYPSFIRYNLLFDFDHQTNKFKLIVDADFSSIYYYKVSLQSVWLSPVDFHKGYLVLHNAINHLDELPF